MHRDAALRIHSSAEKESPLLQLEEYAETSFTVGSGVAIHGN
jgi:hypothetical protein